MPKPKKKTPRVYTSRMWVAARMYRADAAKCYKARAYFSAVVASACQLEALLRIFDFVNARRARDRCHSLNGLINRAFLRHWIPHDGLSYWKRHQRIPLKTCLMEVREARNGVHAHLFKKGLFTRRTAQNVAYLVETTADLLETKNARNLMRDLHAGGHISAREYNTWKRRQETAK